MYWNENVVIWPAQLAQQYHSHLLATPFSKQLSLGSSSLITWGVTLLGSPPCQPWLRSFGFFLIYLPKRCVTKKMSPDLFFYFIQIYQINEVHIIFSIKLDALNVNWRYFIMLSPIFAYTIRQLLHHRKLCKREFNIQSLRARLNFEWNAEMWKTKIKKTRLYECQSTSSDR